MKVNLNIPTTSSDLVNIAEDEAIMNNETEVGDEVQFQYLRNHIRS